MRVVVKMQEERKRKRHCSRREGEKNWFGSRKKGERQGDKATGDGIR